MLKVYTKSDIGLVRKSNEDACNGGLLPEQCAWAVVCDGMGGAKGGNVASSIAVDKITECILSRYRSDMDDTEIKELISGAIAYANGAVHVRAGSDDNLNGMGTTVVVAVVVGGKAHVAHAGDSRAYLITPEEIRQLTTDHSMVQEMVDKGDLTAQEARIHPQKNIITRALGVESSILIDYCEAPFLSGSLLLICTDGLTNYLDENQIFSLSKELEPEELTQRLVTLAKDAGGSDNITVAVVAG